VASESLTIAPHVDLPILSVRWEGLVVTVDANTLNTLLRRVLRRVEGIDEVLVEPESGRLGVAIRVKKSGFTFTVRTHLSALRVKDGYLGFHVADASLLGLPLPRMVFEKLAEKGLPGRAVYFHEDRIFVINLNSMLPPELTVDVEDVVCENGEVRLVFGPSRYRLDKLIEELGKDPFSED